MAFKIIATTDVHGNVLAYNFVNNSIAKKGLSRLSTFLKEQREKYDIIYVDNGDINQGTPLVTYSNYNLDYNIISKALNYLQCDYYSLGNHDFNYGVDFLNNFIKENNAKCITRNILYKKENIGNIEIKTIDNKKIAFIGVVTDYIPHWEKPENLQNIDILDVFSTVQKDVDSVRNDVDYIVVVYHGGFEKNIETGEISELQTGENVGYKMCESINGIDLMISGHQHRNLVGKINNTVIVQTSDTCINCMEILFDNDTITAKLIPLEDYDVDTEFENEFSDVFNATNIWLDKKIGESDIDMYISNFKEAQLQKHPISSFINKVQMQTLDADISACCLFEVMPGFGKQIKIRDIILNYPFPNTLVLKEISGIQIIEYLNQLAQYWIIKDDKVEINEKFLIPKRQLFNYDLLDGIEYTINIFKNKKNYVSNVLIDNKPIELEKTYTLAINNYRASGGGEFSLFPQLKTLKEDSRDIADILIDYVQENKKISVSNIKNIKYIIEK